MALVNMKEMLAAARKAKKAVGAFNITNYETAAAVLKAASYNQCVSLGIPDRGEIAPGKIADIVLVDGDLNPRCTIVNGEIRWHS